MTSHAVHPHAGGFLRGKLLIGQLFREDQVGGHRRRRPVHNEAAGSALGATISPAGLQREMTRRRAACPGWARARHRKESSPSMLHQRCNAIVAAELKSSPRNSRFAASVARGRFAHLRKGRDPSQHRHRFFEESAHRVLGKHHAVRAIEDRPHPVASARVGKAAC